MVTEVAFPPTTLPNPMDVVWCRFPYEERPGVPGLEPHPALVFETKEFRQDVYAVQVVYGTSNIQRPNGPHFVVSNLTEMNYAGLDRETAFDLGRSRWIVWTSRWFEIPDTKKYSTPVIGCIRSNGQAVLAQILRQRKAQGLRVP